MQPPISSSYVQVDEAQWVNQISGDVVLWNYEQGVYQNYSPQSDSWSWWGPTPQHTLGWHPYTAPTAVRAAKADVWFCGLIGLVILICAGTHGHAAIGAILFFFFFGWGAFLSYLHARHPAVYTAVGVAGWVGVAGTIHGYNQTSRQNPIPHIDFDSWQR